jgi:hypothetical protein
MDRDDMRDGGQHHHVHQGNVQHMPPGEHALERGELGNCSNRRQIVADQCPP